MSVNQDNNTLFKKKKTNSRNSRGTRLLKRKGENPKKQ